jgi:hypothetical protein
MPLTSGASHLAIDNFHSARGALSYYVLGNTVQFQSRNGDTFYVSYQDVQNPLTGNLFGSLAEFIAWLDMNTFS